MAPLETIEMPTDVSSCASLMGGGGRIEAKARLIASVRVASKVEGATVVVNRVLTVLSGSGGGDGGAWQVGSSGAHTVSIFNLC